MKLDREDKQKLGEAAGFLIALVIALAAICYAGSRQVKGAELDTATKVKIGMAMAQAAAEEQPKGNTCNCLKTGTCTCPDNCACPACPYIASYAEASAAAIAGNKGLLVFVGVEKPDCSQFRDCVCHSTKTFPGVTGSAIVVGVPDGKGALDRIADVPAADLTSVHLALARWKSAQAPLPAQPIIRQTAPYYIPTAPLNFGGFGGGCPGGRCSGGG